MPELPDVAVYIERLSALFGGQVLERTRLKSPFLVRSFEPPLEAAHGQRVVGFRRIGKRIVFELSGDLFLVFHLMIAGRFHLKEKGDKLAGKAEQGLIARVGLIESAVTVIEPDPTAAEKGATHIGQGIKTSGVGKGDRWAE